MKGSTLFLLAVAAGIAYYASRSSELEIIEPAVPLPGPQPQPVRPVAESEVLIIETAPEGTRPDSYAVPRRSYSRVGNFGTI